MQRVLSLSITVVTRISKRTENSKGYSERMRIVTINLGVSSNQIWVCILRFHNSWSRKNTEELVNQTSTKCRKSRTHCIPSGLLSLS